jgi:hypothetical protein
MAAKANIIIDQGADFATTITVTDEDNNVTDLTGYTASGQIRKHYTSTTAYDFSIAFQSPRSDGRLAFTLAKEITGVMEAGRYVYDIELTSSSGAVSRLVEGTATVTPQVTRT